MENFSQEKYRGALIEKYEQRAWECFALFAYYGRQYEAIENNCKNLDKQIEATEAKIKEIEAEAGSQENYEKAKLLKEEVKKMEGQISKVGEFGKKFFEKATVYQEEGGRCLEQVEYFREFKIKTPEQIEADKHAKVEEQPAQTNT